MKYASLKDMFNDLESQVVENCVECGECVSSCPVFPLSDNKERSSSDVVGEMLGLLKTGEFSPTAYLQAFGCSGCEQCIDVCPQELNPMVLHQLVRNRLISEKSHLPGGLPFMLPLRKPFLPEVLGAIQMKPSEAKWDRQAPHDSPAKDVVVFMGCTYQATPHTILALVNVLEAMDIDFAALCGGKLCCGITHLFAGELDEAEELARDLVRNVRAFSPKKLVLACPTCHNQFTNLYPAIMDIDFEVQLLPAFLRDNIEKLSFTKPLKRKVTIHEPCHLARSIKDYESVRTVIDAIPGLELAEMQHCKQEALCCGGFTGMTYPEYGMGLTEQLLKEVEDTKADVMINVCPNCHVTLSAFQEGRTFGLSDIPSLLNEAIGGPAYEDKLVKFHTIKELDRFLNEARENIEASEFSHDQMREIIPMIFKTTS